MFEAFEGAKIGTGGLFAAEAGAGDDVHRAGGGGDGEGDGAGVAGDAMDAGPGLADVLVEFGSAEDGGADEEQNYDGHDEPVEGGEGAGELDVGDEEGEEDGEPDEGVEVVADGHPVVAIDAVPDQDADGGEDAPIQTGFGGDSGCGGVVAEARGGDETAGGEEGDGEDQEGELAVGGHGVGF